MARVALQHQVSSHAISKSGLVFFVGNVGGLLYEERLALCATSSDGILIRLPSANAMLMYQVSHEFRIEHSLSQARIVGRKNPSKV
jgi:hypothetical protein